jgi:hypothetical protein
MVSKLVSLFTLNNNRKYYVTMMSMLMSTGVLLLDKISDDIYLGLILGTVGAFITGNVMEWKNRNDTKTES